MKKITLFCLILLCNAYLMSAQEIVISGMIVNAADKEAIPFAHVGIENQLTGTMANENGEFEISVSSDDEFLVFTAIGYKETKLPITNSQQDLIIKLELWSNTLEEATVMPKSAKEYILLALERHPNNITSKPFTTQTYFSSSNIMENKGLTNVKKDEAVFLTYYPNYSDTSLHNQNKLLLHQFSDNGVEVDISMIDNKKVRKKMDKIKEKQEKRDAKLAENTEVSEGDEPTEVNAFAGGKGPDFVLSAFQNISGLLFLNELFIDDIEFTIGKPSFYGNKELMTINFQNEKPIMLMFRFTGTFYLDSETLAIVAIDYTENVKIPAIFRPVIKGKTGVNIMGFENKVTIQHQQHDALWYPQQIVYKSKINLKEGKAFRKNEHLYLSNKMILNVEKVNTSDTVEEILPEERYDSSKGYKDQVIHNSSIQWSDINRVN